MADAMKVLLERRSVRSYNDKKVDPAIVDQILEAGLYAPSAMGRQGVVMVAVQNEDMVAKLSKMNAAVMNSQNDPFYGAKSLIIVLSDVNVALYPAVDGALAMGNLLNAAYANGLGSCWINRAKEMFETDEGKALLKEWGLTGRYEGVGICILGYTDTTPVAAPRKEGRIFKVN